MSESSSSKKKKAGRKTLSVVAVIVIVLLLLLLLLPFLLGPTVKTGIKSIVPAVTKCDVDVDDVKFNPFKGNFEITNLVLHNPEGYKTDHAFSLGRIAIKVNVKSLLSDTIEINEIIVENPEITYELGLGNSNIGTILKALPASEEQDEETEQEGGKKVVIDLFKVTGGRIGFATKLTGNNEAPIVLAPIELHDLGKEKGGITIVHAVSLTLKTLLFSILESAKQVGSAVMEGVQDIGSSAVESVKSTFNGIKNLIPGKD